MSITTASSIANHTLAVRFGDTSGLPVSYDLPGLGTVFAGAPDVGHGPRVLVAVGGLETALSSVLSSTVVEGQRAISTYTAGDADGTWVSFGLVFELTGRSLAVRLEGVSEPRAGIELIQIELPALASVDTGSADAWIAHADGGGVHSLLSEAQPCVLEPSRPGEFPNLIRLPLVLLGHSCAALAMEVQGYLSNTALEVRREDGVTTATIGAGAVHRVPGGPATPSLPADQPEIVRIDVIGPPDRGRAPDWIDVGLAVRAHVPPRRSSYFDDKFMYAVLGQLGHAEAANTFPQIEQLIARVSALTDQSPQVVFVAGWNAGGHDTGYPNITEANPVLGGADGWAALQRTARERYDANVTLDDNWDDMYDNEFSRGAFDEAYLARDRDGSVQTQERWNGVDMSQITGFAKYLAPGAPGLDRMRETIERYNIRDAMLIDAMSWWSVRHDWDPAAPASAVRNLREGKFRLLAAFRERGIEVGSEVLTYPFIGQLPFTMDGPTGSEWNGFAGSAIPLMAHVLRCSLIYGAAGGGDASYPSPAVALFHNNRAAKWFDTTTPDHTITGMYYAHYLPWMLFSPLDIVAFERRGSLVSLRLSEDSTIDIDEATMHATARYRGVTVLDGDSVTIPLGRDRIAFYSERDGILSHPAPADGRPVRVERLTRDGREPHPYELHDGNIVVAVTAQVPVVARILDPAEDAR